jgi:hypothetical protein
MFLSFSTALLASGEMATSGCMSALDSDRIYRQNGKDTGCKILRAGAWVG